MDKPQLREKYLANYTIDDARDEKIMDSIISFMHKYQDIHLVGIYLSIEKEIDISYIMMKFPNVKFSVPKISDANSNMLYVNYALGAGLAPNKIYNKYYEPISNTEIFPKLVFVPGIAYSLDGHRLGRGKGHYDRYFAKHNPIKIGLCPSCNLVMNLPNEIYDRKMDYIITEDIILDLCS